MNHAKFKALVHYIIAKSDPTRLGTIRLNKILWYLDTLSYQAEGASVTGDTYVKRQHGPVPQHILNVIGELEHENAIVVRKRSRFGKPMTDFIAMSDADTGVLSPAELELADELRVHICDDHTANSISELSHDQIWEAANLGEVIPLSASLVSAPGEITDEFLKWADSVRERYEAIKRAA
jgi:hypothetical protein